MTKLLSLTLMTTTLVAMGGCASLRSVSSTSIPADRSRPVTAQVSDWNVLGLKFDNDFVDALPGKLQSQCPNGNVRGILTKYETFFYVLAAKRVATAEGFCVVDGKGGHS